MFKRFSLSKKLTFATFCLWLIINELYRQFIKLTKIRFFGGGREVVEFTKKVVIFVLAPSMLGQHKAASIILHLSNLAFQHSILTIRTSKWGKFQRQTSSYRTGCSRLIGHILKVETLPLAASNDFDEAQALWDDPWLLEAPARTDDELRFIAIGKIGTRHWSGIYTLRNDRIRIISVRRAWKQEIGYYESSWSG